VASLEPLVTRKSLAISLRSWEEHGFSRADTNPLACSLGVALAVKAFAFLQQVPRRA
jgi:hypothetical protein